MVSQRWDAHSFDCRTHIRGCEFRWPEYPITKSKDMREARSNIQMVFQDPFSSLNPQRPLFDQVAEPLRNYGTVKREVLQEKIGDLFDRVKLPRSFMQRYPHQLSGGQRQRIAIACISA